MIVKNKLKQRKKNTRERNCTIQTGRTNERPALRQVGLKCNAKKGIHGTEALGNI